MIYEVPFSVYERLASAKMNAFEAAINAHTHDGTYGYNIAFSSLTGFIDASQIPSGGTPIITGAMIVDGTITASDIASNTITMVQIDNNIAHANSVKLSNDGYAVYAP